MPPSQLWRVTDRATFAALRRGARARNGPLTVTWIASPTALAEPPRVAFAVGRVTGGAVTRNRIRRRLRAAFRDLGGRGSVPAGSYLVGATAPAATMNWLQLVDSLDSAVRAATGVSR